MQLGALEHGEKRLMILEKGPYKYIKLHCQCLHEIDEIIDLSHRRHFVFDFVISVYRWFLIFQIRESDCRSDNECTSLQIS